MNKSEMVKVFFLGMIVALLGVIALRGGSPRANAANAAISASGDLMAIAVGHDSGDKSTLYLIDPANKYVAHYTYDGSKFLLRAARTFKYDLSIGDETSKSGFDIKKAKKAAEKWAKSASKF